MYSEYVKTLTSILTKVEFYRGQEIIGNLDSAFENVCNIFRIRRESGAHVFFVGNGGSAGIAQHMTADFLKNAGLKTISLYNQANLTCLGNDIGYGAVFASQIEWLAESGDLLVAISSSGNSENIIKSIEAMQKVGGTAVTLTGFDRDNRCKRMGDINIYVPVRHYGMVESIHNMLLQQIVDTLA